MQVSGRAHRNNIIVSSGTVHADVSHCCCCCFVVVVGISAKTPAATCNAAQLNTAKSSSNPPRQRKGDLRL